VEAVVIAAEDWIWCGYAGHFIGAASCRFHLTTRVGDVRVSTVGDYHPPHHEGPDPKPIGGGGRTYETFVFRVEGPGDGTVADWGEVDSDAYIDSEMAEAGHMAMCRKWEAK
jgi:hypothetical protein